MYDAGYDPLHLLTLGRIAAAIFLTGCVIQLMDDFLDLRYDVMTGYEGLAVRLGEGTLPYALLLFAFAVMAHTPTAVGLLIGAYVMGMAGEYNRPLPSGIKGYQEGVVVLLVAALSIGWVHTLWGALLMFGVQSADDLHDLPTDTMSGNPNLARQIGIVELHLAGLLSIICSALLKPVSTAIVFITLPIVLAADQWLARPLPKRRGWEF